MSFRPLDSLPAVPAFGEAVAQWRLQLRTEVKRASSLPSSMFDACDPMLETRLAETAETMLACLHEPDAAVAAPQPHGEQRIEQVSAAELAALPAQLANGAEPAAALALDSGLRPEYLGILTDCAVVADSTARRVAARLLARDFGITPQVDIAVCTAELARSIAGGVDAATLEAICHRLAIAVAEALRPHPDEEGK